VPFGVICCPRHSTRLLGHRPEQVTEPIFLILLFFSVIGPIFDISRIVPCLADFCVRGTLGEPFYFI